MARGKITEIIKSNIENITQRQIMPSKKTEIMRTTNNSKVTWVMDAENPGAPIPLEEGSLIGEYKIIDVLSENTGEATLLLVERGTVKYVIKLYHKNKTPKPEMLSLLDSIQNKYVIHSVESGTIYERFYEVLPYYVNGDLLAQLPITEEQIEQIIVPCINEGLKSLHEKEIIHRDIKPSNIFFSEKKDYVVIGDFGISSVLDQDVSVRATSMSRTLGYSAPETSNGFISKESDYYSFGITLYHLILGVDPFAGMSDMQILYQTINKKLELPQNISNRLRKLILGLTLKDRNDRWGYEEVCRWIAGEDVEIQEQVRPNAMEKPYSFAKESYDNLQSLSMAFAENWDNAKKHLFRGLIEKYLATYDAEMASQCMDLKELQDKDRAVFELIHLINPGAPLCYKGRLFNDVQAIGKAMSDSLPNFDKDIVEMTQNGCLSKFLEWNKFSAELCNAVYDVEEALSKNANSYAYYTLMYVFNPNIGYEVNSVKCEDIQDFIEYLENMDQVSRDSIMDSVVDDKLFVAWVASQGYGKQVEKWLEIYEKVEW